jgi:hypothetical protein
LISIHSAEENEFIRNYIEEQPSSSTRVWIGLKRSPDSHNFVWVDKSPVDYVNWNINEPDSSDRTVRTDRSDRWFQYCAEMLINGMWDDDADYVNNEFVCGSNCKLLIKISK